jgi:hypothetical protein
VRRSIKCRLTTRSNQRDPATAISETVSAFLFDVPVTPTAASCRRTLRPSLDTPRSPKSLITRLVSQGHGSFAGLSVTKRSIGDKESCASCDIVPDDCSAPDGEHNEVFVMPRSLVDPELGLSEMERPIVGMVSVTRLLRGRVSCWANVNSEKSQECTITCNGLTFVPALKTCHLFSS